MAGGFLSQGSIARGGRQPNPLGLLCRRYVILLLGATLLVSAICVCGSVLLLRSPSYPANSTYPYDALVQQRFALEGADYDVLVVGDSSALRGVVPALVKKETGLKIYNAGLTAFSGLASYDLLLRRYLERNAAPKLIVLYVTPRFPSEDISADTYEKTVIVFRYGSLADIVRQIAEAPGSLLRVESTLRDALFGPDGAGRGEFLRASEESARSQGYVGADSPPLRDDCRLDTRDDIGNKGALLDFRRRWASRVADVAIYVAPMPACDSAYPYYLAEYHGISANTLAQLPGHDFLDYTHATRAGAVDTSHLFAEFLMRRRQNWK